MSLVVIDEALQSSPHLDELQIELAKSNSLAI